MNVYEYQPRPGEDRVVVTIGGVDHVLTVELAAELRARLDTALASVRRRRESQGDKE